MYNKYKAPSFVHIIHSSSLGFPSRCPESSCSTDSCFQGTSCENHMMYGGLYQHTRVVLYINLILHDDVYLRSGHEMLTSEQAPSRILMSSRPTACMLSQFSSQRSASTIICSLIKLRLKHQTNTSYFHSDSGIDLAFVL